MTYRERFNQALEEQIAAGGDAPRMVTLVNVYQGTDATARHFAFREWLEGASLVCGRCFMPVGAAVGEADEDAEVLCSWCRHGFAEREPVPGWKRTWARW